jgi:hypothetical protein
MRVREEVSPIIGLVARSTIEAANIWKQSVKNPYDPLVLINCRTVFILQ